MKRIIGLTLVCFTLLSDPAFAATKSIGKDNVNIRSGPSLNDKIIYEAPLGYPIKIEKEQGKWVFFRDWENDAGWVYKSFVSEIPTAVVLVKVANVRNSPGTAHKVVAKVHRGEIYKIVGKKGDWIKLGYYSGGEEIGWIRRDLLFGD
ncbi:SH3 domain-containing protein [Desulforhabdus amnigena]|uniref:SH3b domain-containing protein n=1 Tax=Desulforhabdus amnigena TaxID=40218 RepID=A0A9W6L892_9BACT|nr:SH3 domain-containing protein [Desulforhabdus amnigena]NLJ28497.1 SH3 domain-containing protein [Deltaproteobacteria bacterium]GLI35382.1 hypothetical protein DAMNIGENAA_28150 [Desulforhabdus amnigena]